MKVTESARVHRFQDLVAVDFKNPNTETLYLSERTAFQLGHVLVEHSADVTHTPFQDSTLGTITIQGNAAAPEKPGQDSDENKRRLLGRLSGLASFYPLETMRAKYNPSKADQKFASALVDARQLAETYGDEKINPVARNKALESIEAALHHIERGTRREVTEDVSSAMDILRGTVSGDTIRREAAKWCETLQWELRDAKEAFEQAAVRALHARNLFR